MADTRLEAERLEETRGVLADVASFLTQRDRDAFEYGDISWRLALLDELSAVNRRIAEIDRRLAAVPLIENAVEALVTVLQQAASEECVRLDTRQRLALSQLMTLTDQVRALVPFVTQPMAAQGA